MNERKVEEINQRIDNLERLSNGRGRIIDGRILNPQYLEEYSDLKEILNLLEENKTRISGIPYVAYNDVMIREDLLNDYKKLMYNLGMENTVPFSPTFDNQNKEETQEKNQKEDEKVNKGYTGSVKPNESLVEHSEKENQAKKDTLEEKKEEILKILNRIDKNPEFKERYKDLVINTNNEEELNEYFNDIKNLYSKELYMAYSEALETLDSYNLPGDIKEEYKNRLLNAKTVKEIDSTISEALEEYKKINGANPEYTGPVKPNESLSIVEQPEKEETNKKRKLVTKIRSAKEFLKKHKKKIIVAVGLAALAAAFVPGVVPSLMYANSVLWGHVPFALQQVLHACNSMLSILVGATFDGAVWYMGGTAINATAASGSIIGALGTIAAGVVGSTAIVSTIKMTIQKIKDKRNKKKENHKQEKIESKTESQEEEKNKENIIRKKLSSTNLLERVDGLMDMYAEYMEKMPEEQMKFQNDIKELGEIRDIILKGRDTSISNTINFEGYRIDPKDKNRLEQLLEKYGITYEKSETKENDDKINIDSKENEDKPFLALAQDGIPVEDLANLFQSKISQYYEAMQKVDITHQNEIQENINELSNCMDKIMSDKEEDKKEIDRVMKKYNMQRLYHPSYRVKDGENISLMPHASEFKDQHEYNEAVNKWYIENQNNIILADLENKEEDILEESAGKSL